MSNGSKIIIDLRDSMIRSYKQSLIAKGITNINCGPGSDIFIRFDAVAESLAIPINKAEGASSELFLDTCSSDSVLKHAKVLGLQLLPASYASGAVRIVCSNPTGVTITKGSKLVNNATGSLYTVTSETAVVLPNGAVNVIADVSGDAGNLDYLTKLQWVVSVATLGTFATVDQIGISNGFDAESVEALRQRCLTKIRRTMQGANSSHCISEAEKASSAIHKAFCYSCLNGPGTSTIVLMGYYNKDSNYNREINYDVILKAAELINEITPGSTDLKVQSVNEESTDLLIGLTLPLPAIVQGSGNGWIDSVPFPTSNALPIPIITIESSTCITVDDGDCNSAPVAGNAIAIWDNLNKNFMHARILSYTNSAGKYFLNLDRPIAATVGQYVSPDAINLDQYGIEILNAFQLLGPSEMTVDPDRLERARRMPEIDREYFNKVNHRTIRNLLTGYVEISDVDLLNATLTQPTVPTVINTNPNVLSLGNLGFMKIV